MPPAQPADRLHLLRLAQLLFEQAPVGDVLHRAHHPQRASLRIDPPRLLVHPAHVAVGPDEAVLDVVGRASRGRGGGGGAHRAAIVGMHQRQERFRRSGKLARRHAEDAVRLRRPVEAIRTIELRHPAAEMCDFLRLLQEGLMLRQQLGGANGGADVAEAHRSSDDPCVQHERRHEAFDHASVLEPQSRRAAPRLDRPRSPAPSPARRWPRRGRR